MKILLINPPNCGRSIPEERYGITSIKQIFRGEPLGLEELAGNLDGHEVQLVDLKADPGSLEDALRRMRPEVVGITGMTCEAKSMRQLARTAKTLSAAQVIVGGIHASLDPEFFNQPEIDYLVTGLGKRSFAALVAQLETGRTDQPLPGGVYRVTPGTPLVLTPHRATEDDLVNQAPPAYHLTARYREHYVLEKLGLRLGFVASAYGCPHDCAFCAIRAQTGGRYLVRPVAAVLRDIALLPEAPVIRLVDANTFGRPDRARELAQALIDSGIKKQYLADIRSDTVVRHPEMLRLWKQAGLRAVIIGFEATEDARLAAMNKANQARMNTEAIAILGELGITLVGDFIIAPEDDEEDFDRLQNYLEQHPIDLPMITVLTPFPGTPLHQARKDQITNHDLDYYTLTNAVTPTRLPEHRFYTRYAELLQQSHQRARL